MRSAFHLRGLSLLLLGGLLLAPLVRADDTAPPPPLPTIPWDSAKQGAFVMCLCADKQGKIWIGTEDEGVWRYDRSAPAGKQYTNFTTHDGLGDNDAYALTCDSAGRIWVGTLNHGVSVYNGKEWKTYAPPYGPLGLRVFTLATSPIDGDVWIATEAGLTRYSLAHDTWTDYTSASGDGLPRSAASALAFDAKGTLYVGTQCDGIAIGSDADNYHTWRIVYGPAQMPNTSMGTGLPSDLINCLLVAQSGRIYAGTNTGLARSDDGGKTWQYTRGGDWQAKVTGLYQGPKPIELISIIPLQLEDYVTCLAEDDAGHLLIGHRQDGLDVMDTATGARLVPGPQAVPPGDFVMALLPRSGLPTLAGWYGTGLTTVGPARATETALDPAPASLGSADPPALPSPASPPNLAQMNALLLQVAAVEPDPQEMEPRVAALADDWLTEGNWLGRYGRYWACLPATFHPTPLDYLWGAGWEPVNYDLTMGPNHPGDDRLRYWMQLSYTDNPRVLELPTPYLHSRVLKGYTTWEMGHRDSEVDDHGETYPSTLEGPNVYATVTVPGGLFTLSLYDFNPNGHTGPNRFRDYRLSIRAHSGLSLEDVSSFATQPELAHGRIKDFWGGVWKRFLVRGPITLTVEVGRSNSANTMLCAIMLDLADEDPAPYFQTVDQWNSREAQRAKKRQKLVALWPQTSQRFHPAASESEAANRLFDALDEQRLTNSEWWATEGRRYYIPLLRWYHSVALQPASGSRVRLFQRQATCRYEMGQYAPWEDLQKAAGQRSVRDIEKSLRWDGVTDSYSGLGNEVVNNYLTAHSGHKESLAR